MSDKKYLIERHIIVTLAGFSIAGLYFPDYFSWAKNLIHPMLALIAFCVGLTLKPTNFLNAWENKKLIAPILTFKYIFTPFITFFICTLLRVPILYTIGLVTLTCCPAANTGNIMCYLSKGNTAMIVITTLTGALLAPLITPIIIFILLHQVVQIQLSDVIFIIMTGITIPMIIGIIISHYFSSSLSSIKFFIPSTGILAVSIIVTAILSQHANQIIHFGIEIPILCFALITFFLISGFLFSRLIKCEMKNSIAMTYEIGTFDGVLGILLTMQIAGNNATLPVVLFAVLNLIIGSIASKIFTSKKFMEFAK